MLIWKKKIEGQVDAYLKKKNWKVLFTYYRNQYSANLIQQIYISIFQ